MVRFFFRVFRAVLRFCFTAFLATSSLVVGLLLFGISLQYAFCPIYDFPVTKPFAGNYWFNPYDSVAGDAVWLKANFHAHSKAWGGLTNGHQTPEEVYAAYKQFGYDVAGLSNYHSISSVGRSSALYVPVYEHGYNVKKSHRLAIGAREIVWLDYPLGQMLHHKQHIVNRLSETAAITAIAHPRFAGGHPPDNFRSLTGYTLIEVLNHFRISDEHWDSCLSAGHAKWVLADDDTHDIRIATETGALWTMIAPEKGSQFGVDSSIGSSIDDVYEALRRGRHYGVRGGVSGGTSGGGGVNDNPLRSVQVRADTLHVWLAGQADSIVFVGQYGRHRQSSIRTASAAYPLQTDDTYIRAVVYNPRSTLYLNPVIRYDGRTAPHKAEEPATVNVGATWLLRAACGTGYAVIFWLGWLLVRASSRKRARRTQTNFEGYPLE